MSVAPRLRRLSAPAVAVTVVLAVAGCGTTLQVADQSQVQATTANGGDLSVPTPTGGGGVVPDGAPSAPGSLPTSGASAGGPSSVVPGSTTAVTSSRGAKGSTAPSAASSSSGPVSHTPIQVGFLSTDTGNASSLGLNAGTTVSNTAIINAAVKAMNAQGGLDGRKIEPVIATTDTGGGNWATEFQAACAAFTQDHHVSAVLGYQFDLLPAFESCLSQAHVVHLNAGYEAGDTHTLATYPGLFSLVAPSDEQSLLLQVAGPYATGELTSSDKIGLLNTSCGDQVAALNNAVLPFIARHHLKVAASTTLSCGTGAGDAGAIAAQISGALLRFESSGVNRVVGNGVAIAVFAIAAQTQGYHPDYLVTSTAGGAALEPNVPAAQLAHFHGYGYFSPIDVDPSHQPRRTASQNRCLALLKSQGLAPKEYNDYALMYTTCDSLFLYEAALKADGGNADEGAVVAAIDRLGSSYQSVSGIDGASYFSANQHAGPMLYRPFNWDGGCRCFAYTGAPKRIPSS